LNNGVPYASTLSFSLHHVKIQIYFVIFQI
jgi:hypothetical protein